MKDQNLNKYEELQIEVIEFENEDVITTSGGPMDNNEWTGSGTP